MGGRRGRFSFLREEYEGPDGERREEGREEPRAEPQEGAGEVSGPADRAAAGGAGETGGPTTGALGVPGGRQGRSPGTGPQSRRRRQRNPKALRNDPSRKVIGAYVRKDVKREVDRALQDERLFPNGDGSLSLLVEGLLERWLDESGYGVGEGG